MFKEYAHISHETQVCKVGTKMLNVGCKIVQHTDASPCIFGTMAFNIPYLICMLNFSDKGYTTEKLGSFYHMYGLVLLLIKKNQNVDFFFSKKKQSHMKSY